MPAAPSLADLGSFFDAVGEFFSSLTDIRWPALLIGLASFGIYLSLRSRAYDLVVDGWELGGGSIRISDRQVQERVLEILGIGPEEAQARFGFLLDAMRYGPPPLGGIAMGLDRIVAVLAGRGSIRDVIAFPKTATGADPLTGAPAEVDERQLRELGLQLRAARPHQR